MAEFIARLEIEDFDVWRASHDANAFNRQSHGMLDRARYRDVDDPSSVLIHVEVEDLERALQWLQSEEGRLSAAGATIKRRDFFVVQKVELGLAEE